MNNDNNEKAILVGVKLKEIGPCNFESSMEELKGLAKAAGAMVEATIVQAKDRPQSSTYIGKGKLEELKHLAAEIQPDLVIFDNELSPVQIRNLEEELEVRIVDRTMLILDIFGQRACSREGILQVELASLEYRLPRLTGRGVQMSRVGAGIGTRGAGEQKLELDRRHIRARILDIKRQMLRVRNTRELHRKQRRRAGFKLVSLVGYTNAGKSSLFNAVCKVAHRSGNEQVEADIRLFQTLDTTTRKVILPAGNQILISDTVGFIQNLPHHLVKSFHATLEEAVQADLLLHVIDVSDPEYLDKITVVNAVLEELKADMSKIVVVFTKADLLKGTGSVGFNGENCVSSKTGEGVPALLQNIEQHLFVARNG